MAGMYVIKRNGSVVEFDAARIEDAIKKAARSAKVVLEEEVLEAVLFDIQKEIEERFTEFYPNVENIQDIIEKHLVKKNLYEISKEYILYRAERKRVREQERKENIEKTLLGRLTVIKRDGRKVLFNQKKIRDTLDRVSKGYKEFSFNLVFKEFMKNIYDGITTTDIEKALILATVSFMEKDPLYSNVASKLFQMRLNKEVMGKSITREIAPFAYREAFVDNIKKGVEQGYLDKRMLDFDLEKLSYGLKLERDDLLEYMGIQTLYERYFMKNRQTRMELAQSFWMRVAMGLALEEKEKEQRALEFYEVLSSLRFVSSTPTLFHSGTTHPQLSSCYLTTVMDDLQDIFKAFSDNAQLSKWSGGLGNDWTNIRSTGAWINSTNVESQGVIPFLKIANDVTAAINRSGKRRGATCAYLECWHLDYEDFLDLRKNTGDDRRRAHDMNTASWIPDLFMKRVKADESWTLFSPDEVSDLHHIYGKEFEKKYEEYERAAENGKIRKHKVIPAKKLWRKMISMLFETGHPWMTFKDPCNIRSPQDHVGVIHNSNLCTEITLNTSKTETAVCNLGSINLGMHLDEQNQIDEKLLAKTVKTAVRMLDNVIDINYYPTKEAKNSNMLHRPIGLGIMGVQDMFFKMRLAFDSPKAIQTSDKVMEFISFHAIEGSSDLAKEKGPYQSFKGSKWDRGIFPLDTLDILEKERGEKIPVTREERMDWITLKQKVKQQGMRNSNTMAIAPTATISTISGCFPCIEPIYKNVYVKSNMSGEFTIVNKYLIEDLKKQGLWNDEMLEQLKYYDGNVSLIAGVPEELKELYKEAFDIDAKIAIDHTAVRAKWIDQSQSHNVFIKGTSGSAFSEAYIYAWEKGLKTTYYLRTLGATQIEKSTLDAKKYGFTQKREYTQAKKEEQPASQVTKMCSLTDPDCEACQ
ncbi:MAG: ribonucleoside-diphosphate reductase subunit alpha [Candidatus Woesearchaeota archaeon]